MPLRLLTRIIALALVAVIPSRLSAQSTNGAVWWTDRPCQSALGRDRFDIVKLSPRLAPSHGCQQESCAHLRGGGQVCQCLSDTVRTITVTGVVPRTLKFERPWSDIRPDTFDVIEADLEGDGSREIVVATLDAVSNGMAVPSWTILALSPGAYGWGIDSLQVEEYSSLGSWVTHRGEKSCNLLQTQWVNGYEAGRGGGLYLQASWQAFEYSRFIQRVDRPVIRRRFLNSFDRQRSDTTIRDAPWAWLRTAPR
jgi:hypothetical protein